LLKKIIILIFPVSLLAQTTKPVPPELVKEYYRAALAVASAKPGWDAMNADLQSALDAIRKSCPEGYEVQQPDQKKDPVCVAKPVPAPPEKK
jgi:hypothetical protein